MIAAVPCGVPGGAYPGPAAVRGRPEERRHDHGAAGPVENGSDLL